MNDFAISVSSRTPSILGLVLAGVWTAGILIMILLVIRSSLRLRRIKKSALPLQNPEVQTIYAGCLRDMNLTKSIPVYSTAFLESPVITGYFRPRIYLPIHLISDCRPSEIRYILLHELQHYRHRDNPVSYTHLSFCNACLPCSDQGNAFRCWNLKKIRSYTCDPPVRFVTTNIS